MKDGSLVTAGINLGAEQALSEGREELQGGVA
jgi:hypothetical protein